MVEFLLRIDGEIELGNGSSETWCFAKKLQWPAVPRISEEIMIRDEGYESTVVSVFHHLVGIDGKSPGIVVDATGSNAALYQILKDLEENPDAWERSSGAEPDRLKAMLEEYWAALPS